MALVKQSCSQKEETLNQKWSQAFLWDDEAECWVLNTAGAVAPSSAINTEPTVDADGELIISSGTYPGGAVITNDSAERVYIGLGFTPTVTDYTLSLAPIDGSGNAESYILKRGDFAGDIEALVPVGPVTVNVTVLS